jgi:hypothetical protein
MMSSELERQLTRALRRHGTPFGAAEARARAAAFAVLPPARRSETSRLLVAAVAVAVALAVAAVALAASGELHVGLGKKRQNPVPPPPARLTLPPRTHGLALVVGGRLWLATRSGARFERVAASAAALSPRALYVAVGSAHALVAMSPDNRRVAWLRRTKGRVVAIAWAPYPTEVAYIVHRPGRGNELRMIEGDGDHDRLLADHVASAAPSWRADSLAVAFVNGRGKAAVVDFRRSSTRTVSATGACHGRVGAVAFSPRGRQLAIATKAGVGLASDSALRARCVLLASPGQLAGLAWSGNRRVATAERSPSGSVLTRYAVSGGRIRDAGAAYSDRPLLGLTSLGAETGLVVARSLPAGRLELGLVSAIRGRNGRVEPRVLLEVGAGRLEGISWH